MLGVTVLGLIGVASPLLALGPAANGEAVSSALVWVTAFAFSAAVAAVPSVMSKRMLRARVAELATGNDALFVWPIRQAYQSFAAPVRTLAAGGADVTTPTRSLYLVADSTTLGVWTRPHEGAFRQVLDIPLARVRSVEPWQGMSGLPRSRTGTIVFTENDGATVTVSFTTQATTWPPFQESRVKLAQLGALIHRAHLGDE